MGIKRRFFLTVSSSFAISLLFASCTAQPSATTSSTSSPDSTASSPAAQQPLKVGVWFFVAEDILKFVQENLAANEGLDIQIVKFNDWVQPNAALKNGDVDANLFQNRPFMQDSAQKLGANLVMLNLSYLTPMGVYSKRHTSLNAISTGGTLAIPSDATNGDRALRLLAANNLLTLKSDLGDRLATPRDVAENPKNFQIKELEGPNLARAVDDVDVAVFATSVRLQAKLELEPIVQETETASKYTVGFVTVQGKETDPRIQTLNRLLQDPKVRDFIKEKYKGAVIAPF